ncbi:hypothetical protein HYQ46_012678 [Verticillium longisporum]|nr:hypothetical protein HYQ46_012678 [Verticillium longisporum]
MAQGYSIIIGFVVVAALSAIAWFLSPKGENQIPVPQMHEERPQGLAVVCYIRLANRVNAMQAPKPEHGAAYGPAGNSTDRG